MESEAKIVVITSILIFITMIPIAIINEVYGWIPDIIFFIALTLFYAWIYDKMRMNTPILTLLIIGHILHACGIFGWYHTSPIPIGWERITHFFGAMPFAILFFKYREQIMDQKLFTKHNLLTILGVFLAATGIGAIVEMSEFAGYLTLGYGEGALMFGAGDGITGLTGTNLIDAIGGGWINQGWDMITNTLGILTGMAIMLTLRLIRKKPTKAYYFEEIGEYSRKI